MKLDLEIRFGLGSREPWKQRTLEERTSKSHHIAIVPPRKTEQLKECYAPTPSFNPWHIKIGMELLVRDPDFRVWLQSCTLE